MKELGDYLKRTRISNGVSIAEAAEDLDLSTVQLENIESGNVKAFKDVYALKEDVRQYAKYLGLNPEKVIDEFNGFLFEHTSKISLDDIKAKRLICRILFPSYYFDRYDDIMIGNKTEDILYNIINKNYKRKEYPIIVNCNQL